MKQPYSIVLKNGELPAITINAPAVLARPIYWRTRLQWAWRCLRGQTLDIGPAVNVIGCTFTVDNEGTPGLTIIPIKEAE